MPRRCVEAPLTVADVYDVAADIGKEFEHLIDSHGPEHVTSLMQKVISALEHLEKFAAAGDTEEATIEHLRATITHLELEQIKKTEEKHRHSKEVEQIEEHYKDETRDLLSTVKRLQDENRKLSSSLAAAAENQRDSAFSEDESYFEVDLVNRLQTVIDKQRSEIKKLDQAVLDYKLETEELKSNNEKLTSCTRELRRKQRLTQAQLHTLVDERADLTAKMQDAQRDVTSLSKQLGTAAQECQDLSQAPPPFPSGIGGTGSKTGLFDPRGKLIYNENDPCRPRFTLSELKEILQERNGLKARVSDLEDELAVFKPRTVMSSSRDSGAKVVRVGGSTAAALATPCDCSYHTTMKEETLEYSCAKSSIENKLDDKKDKIETLDLSDDNEDNADDDDLPVQGPLPEEPEDGPWRRNESGIRKLFRRVFGPTSPTSTMTSSVSTPALYQKQSQHQGDESAAIAEPSPRRLKKSFSRFSFLLPTNDYDENGDEDQKKHSSED